MIALAQPAPNFKGPPEIIMPLGGYAVFDQLAQMLGIKVIRMTDSPEVRADVDSMAHAITPNSIMLIASAPSYPLCTIDPVAEIAALAERPDLWSPQGAHRVVVTRAAVLDGRLTVSRIAA